MTDRSLPLCEAVTSYALQGPARFHMPGHKGFLSESDVTEIPGTDNLHSPCGAILKSEKLCAEALGVRDAFFLVNGSTAGNLAMLFLLGMGKRVLLGRNCHKSVINGIALADHSTFPLFPDERGLISAEHVRKALDQHPCDAVFITSPTYRGEVSPIAEIAETAHEHGALLFVDCAHGAHFAFSDKLPPLPKEADACCVSSHKTLNALTQTALLLTGESCPFSRREVQRALNMFQSTSPSYELMLSIERSVLMPCDWDAHFERIVRLRERISRIEGAYLYGHDKATQDITRLNIGFYGMTGYALGSYLVSLGIFPEMSDSELTTLITSPSDPDEWYERLVRAISGLRPSLISETNAADLPSSYADVCGRQVLTVRQAVTAKRRLVPLERAEGLVSAQASGCYPPGTALLFPGELITAQAIERLDLESKRGADLFGITDGMAETVDEESSI